jgi:hypothetical protein
MSLFRSDVPQLGSKLSIDRVAEACRSAALTFLDGARAGWEKQDLADWLVGPYRRLTLLRYSVAELAWADVLDSRDAPLSSRPLTHERVQDMIERTRVEVTGRLEGFAQTKDVALFVLDARDGGSVIRCADADGREGFLPADRPGMKLADRVLSLLATDYLLRREDYEQLCTVCWRCETVTFNADARLLGACTTHATSGIRPSAGSGSDVSTTDAAKRDTLRGFPAAEAG